MINRKKNAFHLKNNRKLKGNKIVTQIQNKVKQKTKEMGR